MPTSNGLVTSRDIRQNSVKSIHILDEAVTTAKIPDLAITYPDKIDVPTWTYVFESEPGIDVSLSSTETEYASAVIDIPAWVNQVSVLATGIVAINNSSGGDLNVYASVRIDGSDDGNFRSTVINGDIGQVIHMEEGSLFGVAGSSITISLYSFLDSGTNAVNKGAIWGMAVGGR